MLKQLNLLLKLLIVVGYYELLRALVLLKLLNLLLKLLIVEAVVVESVVEAVDCCRLLCPLENSSFVKSVVEAVDCCRLL